jgi:hypothetical protein
VTLVFRNDKTIFRHYGERTPDEFEAIFIYFRDPNAVMAPADIEERRRL